MILLIQNDVRVPPGIITDILADRGVPYREARLFEAPELPAPSALSGIILLGGYMGVHELAAHPHLAGLPRFLERAFDARTPQLGICLGGQLLAAALGAEVFPARNGERGPRAVALTDAGLSDPLFAGLPKTFPAFQFHSDSFAVPEGAAHLAASPACPGQAFRLGRAYGLQFHPEVTMGIVAAWCRAVGETGPVAEEFAAVEAEHRRLAGRLLENFLDLAGP
ncbi:type 1 glutamine amidotransferase [Desulfuromonas sp.]|uniref:type 1 glutamine amidotransferase n=1 Tax=Desulfuromonas sp. TaxID=892 RepID=UPI0025C1D2C5|nr:type 1 glutamine amidotransferase [Desulfuromonas sp.]